MLSRDEINARSLRLSGRAPNKFTGTLNDPMQEAQSRYAGPGWAQFFGSLQQHEEEAADAGKSYRVGWGGFGNTTSNSLGGAGTSRRPSLAQMQAAPPVEDDGGIAFNQYLSDMQDVRRVREQSLREMTAQNDAVDAAARDREAIDRAVAIANTPGVSQNGRPIVKTGAHSYETAAPDPNAPPVDRRAVLRQVVPGHLQVGMDQSEQTADLARRTMALNEGKLAEEVRSNKAKETAAPPAVSPEGIELAARNFLTTGQMPPLGMGDKTTRQRILDKAGELGGSGASIAANKADYKADSGSLAALQKQRDTIGAFEETAGKNIDIFLNAAGKIVDTGSPLANTLVRHVTGKMLGSPDQAAFDAARQVAVSEIAKITSNPNLTGQLSDSARHEVDAFNPREATLAQSVAVMRILKQDMANRITSLDDAVKNVKGRLRPESPSAPAGFVDMVAPDGRPLHVPSADVDKMLKAGAKRKGGG